MAQRSRGRGTGKIVNFWTPAGNYCPKVPGLACGGGLGDHDRCLERVLAGIAEERAREELKRRATMDRMQARRSSSRSS